MAAESITFKHYTDSSTVADFTTTLPLVDTGICANNRDLGVRHPISVDLKGVLHSFELVIVANDTLVGCEVLAIGLFIKDIREDLM